MAIAPVGRGAGFAPLTLDLLGKAAAGTDPASVNPTGPSSAASFGHAITTALDQLNGLHNTTDGLAQQAVTGKLSNVEDYLTAATETQLTTQLTVAVRNRAVEAFQEIMRMQV